MHDSETFLKHFEESKKLQTHYLNSSTFINIKLHIHADSNRNDLLKCLTALKMYCKFQTHNHTHESHETGKLLYLVCHIWLIVITDVFMCIQESYCATELP